MELKVKVCLNINDKGLAKENIFVSSILKQKFEEIDDLNEENLNDMVKEPFVDYYNEELKEEVEKILADDFFSIFDLKEYEDVSFYKEEDAIFSKGGRIPSRLLFTSLKHSKMYCDFEREKYVKYRTIKKM